MLQVYLLYSALLRNPLTVNPPFIFSPKMTLFSECQHKWQRNILMNQKKERVDAGAVDHLIRKISSRSITNFHVSEKRGTRGWERNSFNNKYIIVTRTSRLQKFFKRQLSLSDQIFCCFGFLIWTFEQKRLRSSIPMIANKNCGIRQNGFYFFAESVESRRRISVTNTQ